MTTLQEAGTKALDALRKAMQGNLDFDVALEAFEALRTALAQQDESAQIRYLKSELAHALAQQGERKNCPQPEICGSKECEFCRDTAAPAQKPVAYITQTEQGPMVWTPEMYDEACTYCDDGEFPVPLYTAAPAPQAQPMTDPCKTCSHFKEGNLPGVRIHDETCYECRSYWGNKWEAA